MFSIHFTNGYISVLILIFTGIENQLVPLTSFQQSTLADLQNGY